MRKDKVFGQLEYEFQWFGEKRFDFNGSENIITLAVYGEEDEEFSAKQYESYTKLLDSWSEIQKSVIDRGLSYYIDLRKKLGYEVQENEHYPKIESKDDFLKHIEFVGITIFAAKKLDGRYVGLTFDCSWDEENGLGFLLINEKVEKIGYQDVSM